MSRRLNRFLLGATAGLTLATAGHAATRPAPLQPDAASQELIGKKAALLDKVAPVTDDMLRNPPPGDWLQWRRTYDEQGFSPLDQINKGNVAGLQTAWAWSLPTGTSEMAPLVHDGVMFLYANNDRIQALDATNGELLWEYVRPPIAGGPWPGMAGTYRRNIAIYGNKIIFPTFDGHEVALDVKTGKIVWDKPVSDSSRALPYRASSGPLVVNGKIMQGVANCSRLQPGGCFVVGIDANTGEQLWRVNTVPRPGEPGDDTWKGVPIEKRQGASIWTTGSYEPDLNLAYFGTGNSYDWLDLVHGDTAINPNKAGLHTNSTLAIDPDTGKLRWHYQHLPQDMWNLDWAFERIIVTLPNGGKPQKQVLATGKMVITDSMDAATGKWVFSKDEGVQNIVQSIDPKTGRKNYNPAAIPDITGARSILQCPSGNGAKNWPSSSYDAATKTLYVVILSENCFESVTKEYGPSSPYTGGEQAEGAARYLPGSDGNIGRIDAINLETKQVVWSRRQRAPMASAALGTAGGVLFVGDADGWFRALDARTGDVLWQERLNSTVNAFPITYSVNGRQYVAVMAGQGLAGHQLNPEINWPAGGSVMWVFELPQPKQ